MDLIVTGVLIAIGFYIAPFAITVAVAIFVGVFSIIVGILKAIFGGR